MRPLNRPMFRNGGPIKEGIMSGMQDRPGYSLGSKVGGFFTNLFKKSAPTGTVAASQTVKKPSVVSAAGTKLKELFTGTKTTTGPGTVTIPGTPPKTIYSGGYSMRVPGTSTTTVPKQGPSLVKTQLQPFTPGGPTNPNIYAAGQRILVPATAAGGKALKAAQR